MGVATRSRSKRPTVDLWSVSYHLEHPDYSAQTPPEARTAATPPRDDPEALQEELRLQRRRELVGRIVPIPREWADALNPLSPVALQPRFDWLRWAKSQRPKAWHDELRWFRWATVLEDGTVIKGYSESGVERLSDTVLRCQPLMRKFGLVVPVFYQNRGWRWTGGCSFVEEFEGITIPRTIILSSQVDEHEMTYALIHELAHTREVPIPQRPWHKGKETRYDYQVSLHSEEFRRIFGELLHRYLENHAQPFERHALLRRARSDSYAPPIWPNGRP